MPGTWSQCRCVTLCCTLVLLLALVSSLADAFEGLLSGASEASRDDAPAVAVSRPHELYPRTGALLQRVRDIAAGCDVASLDFARGAYEGDTPALAFATLQRPRRGVRSRLRRRRTRAMLVFGEAAREAFVTPEVALAFLEAACKQRNDTFALAIRDRLHVLLESADIVVVPLANPAGRRLAEQGAYCEVGNAHGVDLNQNWPVMWGTSRRSSIGLQERGLGIRNGSRGNGREGMGVSSASAGSAPLSEPETRDLQAIVNDFKPNVYVSVQSGLGLSLSPPGDCKISGQLMPDDQSRLNAVSDLVVARHCLQCSHSSNFELTGSDRCGTGVDYVFSSAKSRAQTAFVYTWRIYADSLASSVDCFRAFNPIRDDTLRRVREVWSEAFITLIEAVDQWYHVEHSGGRAAAMRNASQSAAYAMAASSNALRNAREAVSQDAGRGLSHFHGLGFGHDRSSWRNVGHRPLGGSNNTMSALHGVSSMSSMAGPNGTKFARQILLSVIAVLAFAICLVIVRASIFMPGVRRRSRLTSGDRLLRKAA